MTTEKSGLVARLGRFALVIILLLVIAGVASYAVLSDNSIHGLTVRFYTVSWTCSSGSPGLTYTVGSLVVYSSNSLTTSLSHVLLIMSTNGVTVGNLNVTNVNFGPGQSVSYSTVQFTNAGLSPQSQPTSSVIALLVNAQVAAGLYSSQASASYSQLVHFPSLSC